MLFKIICKLKHIKNLLEIPFRPTEPRQCRAPPVSVAVFHPGNRILPFKQLPWGKGNGQAVTLQPWTSSERTEGIQKPNELCLKSHSEGSLRQDTAAAVIFSRAFKVVHTLLNAHFPQALVVSKEPLSMPKTLGSGDAVRPNRLDAPLRPEGEAVFSARP